MRKLILIGLIFLPFLSNSQVKVEDFRTEKRKSDAAVIQAAMNYIDSIGHGALEFDGTRTYKIGQSIELPRYSKSGSRIIVLKGNGCILEAKNQEFIIFNRMPKSQKEALNKMMSTRFVIQDFVFKRGSKGILLGATFGTVIQRCNFKGHKLAAVDILFGLQTVIKECRSTNGMKNNFILRTGKEWGGTAYNSQSNHSVISSCRVYAGKGSYSSFKIMGSNGVVLRDNISEGHNNHLAVYFDFLGSSTVKLFKIENFHLENRPGGSGFNIRHNGIATLDGIYYQKAGDDFPLIVARGENQQLNIYNIPYYVGGTVMKFKGNIAVNMKYCHRHFYDVKNWRNFNKNGKEKVKRPFYFTGDGYLQQVNKDY